MAIPRSGKYLRFLLKAAFLATPTEIPSKERRLER